MTQWQELDPSLWSLVRPERIGDLVWCEELGDYIDPRLVPEAAKSVEPSNE